MLGLCVLASPEALRCALEQDTILCLVLVQPRTTGKCSDIDWDINYQHKQSLHDALQGSHYHTLNRIYDIHTFMNSQKMRIISICILIMCFLLVLAGKDYISQIRLIVGMVGSPKDDLLQLCHSPIIKNYFRGRLTFAHVR